MRSVVLLLASSCALAQGYPSKPIRMVVPFPPGGAVDLTARLAQPRLSQSLGQPVVIDNRVGAGGMIGADFVSKSPPDGYTLAYLVGSDLALRKWVSKVPVPDMLKELTPIAGAVEAGAVVAVNAAVPVGSLQELVDFAKRNPGKLNYASAGIASSQHLTGELFKQHGIDMVHIPFNGLGPAMTALMSGQTEVGISNFSTLKGAMRDGKVKVLAVTQAKRYEGAPQLPTVGEVLPGFVIPSSWFGYFGPPGMPAPLVSRLTAEIGQALEGADVLAKIREADLSVIHSPPAQFAAYAQSTVDIYGKIVQAAKIPPQ